MTAQCANNSPMPKDAPKPTVTAEKGIELIQRQIDAGDTLLQGFLNEAPYESWVNTTIIYLGKAFGTSSLNVMRFNDHGQYGSAPFNAGEEWWGE